MTGTVFNRIFKPLLAGVMAISAVAATSAHASEGWGDLQIVDMTTAPDIGGDMVITTGFLHELDLVAYQAPEMSIAPDGLVMQLAGPEQVAGWSGIVEVEMDDDSAPHLSQLTAFSDTFARDQRETRVRGFYTMRYQFDTDLPFRPYAGAGLGLVGSDSASSTSGVIAGRATAGFDLTMGKQSALFAEYAYVKSGGVQIGMAGNSASGVSIPNSEHSLKLGFRRTF